MPNEKVVIAIVLPIWTIITSMGILTGIDDSVLYRATKCKAEKSDTREADTIFITALISTAVLAVIT